MSIWIVMTGNAAAASAAPSGVASASIPEWIMLLLAALAVAAIAGVAQALGAIRDRLPKEDKPAHREFARMLCDQIWKHTDHMTNVFAQRMRLQPPDIATTRVLVRMLREDLAGPAGFADQMKAQAPDGWPRYGLFAAFGDWSAQLRSLDSQLGDLNQALNYPLVREKPDAHRDAVLVHHYQTEQAIMALAVGQLRGHAFAVCDAARKTLEKQARAGGHHHGEHDGAEEEGHGCPCCRRSVEHVLVRPADPALPVFPPAPPAPPPAPVAEKPRAEAPQMLLICCPAPSPCHCQRGCTCSCGCAAPGAQPVPPAAPGIAAVPVVLGTVVTPMAPPAPPPPAT